MILINYKSLIFDIESQWFVMEEIFYCDDSEQSYYLFNTLKIYF